MGKWKSGLISVVIPVYNGAAYIRECLGCLQRQSYPDFECLVVNDGSSDGTGELVWRLVQKDSRFRLLNQENKGPSGARNTGIEAAGGEYLAFVDADDRPHTDFLSYMAAQMKEDIDCVICAYQRVTVHGRIVRRFVHPDCRLDVPEDWRQEMGSLYHRYLISSLCNKLYRRELIEQRQIRLDERMCLGEDLLFNLDYLSSCKRVQVKKAVLYDYVIRGAASLTASVKEDRVENARLLYHVVDSFCTKWGFAVPPEVGLVYLKSCFTAIEKAVEKNDGSAKSIVKQVLAAEETKFLLAYRGKASMETGLYRMLLSTENRSLILGLARLRSGIKRLLQR